MRLTTAALLTMLATANLAPAQYLPVCPLPGGSFFFPGRGYSAFGWFRGPTVIATPPVMVPPRPGEAGIPPRLARMMRQLPQVPPADELALLARPALPPLPRPEFADRAALLAPPPAANKNDESERQVKLGK